MCLRSGPVLGICLEMRFLRSHHAPRSRCRSSGLDQRSSRKLPNAARERPLKAAHLFSVDGQNLRDLLHLSIVNCRRFPLWTTLHRSGSIIQTNTLSVSLVVHRITGHGLYIDIVIIEDPPQASTTRIAQFSE